MQTTLLLVFVFVWLIFNQYREKEINPRRYIIMPLIIIYFLVKLSTNFDLNLLHHSYIIILLILASLISGFLSGKITKLYKGSNGELLERGGLKSVYFLIGMVGIKIILKIFLNQSLHCREVLSNSFLTLFMFALQYGIKSLVILIREPEILKKFKTIF